MLEKVFYTSVLVGDQDKALDFYTNVLGLEKRVENPTPDGPRFLTVGVKGDDFQLVLWPGTPGQAEPAMGRPPSSSSRTCSSSRGATSRSSRTPTATGYRYERAASSQSGNGSAPRSRPALPKIEHLGPSTESGRVAPPTIGRSRE
jgi:catechol 2,3-dioxygenase-like lactoylglutathione lyase family enzyme